jgi:hypothetical protein
MRLTATILGITLSLAAQEPPVKFSTTVYLFGTTVASNSGFRGDIYHLEPDTEKLPNFSKLKPVGTIYTPYLNVPYRSFDEGFPGITERFEWFAIDYKARFWVSEAGTYRFALESDDGSILYIDDKRIIRNDGQHPVEEEQGKVKLKAGEHTIRVSYFQGPRFHVALTLRVAGPKDKELRVFDTGEFSPPPEGLPAPPSSSTGNR